MENHQEARRSLASMPANGVSGTRYPPLMDDEQRQEPTERTPKGYEVLVPKRGEFLDNLKKVAKPQTPAPRPQQSGMRGKGSRRPPPHHSSGRGK